MRVTKYKFPVIFGIKSVDPQITDMILNKLRRKKIKDKANATVVVTFLHVDRIRFITWFHCTVRVKRKVVGTWIFKID